MHNVIHFWEDCKVFRRCFFLKSSRNEQICNKIGLVPPYHDSKQTKGHPYHARGHATSSVDAMFINSYTITLVCVNVTLVMSQ